MTPLNALKPCPCGSEKTFKLCCERFLSGAERAKTPEQLMRSRYSAHALGTYGDYLVSTWLTAVELGLNAASFDEHKVNWQKLEILQSSQRGDLGRVEFKAWFYAPDSKVLQVHHERSAFKRIKGVWYYTEALAMTID